MKDKLKATIPPKRKLAAILSISFAYAFTLFVYTPMDIYLNNPTQFFVSWRFILPTLLGAFLLSFLAISFVLTMIYHRKIRAGLIMLALLAIAITIARYVFTLLTVVFANLIVIIAVAMVIWAVFIKVLKEDALTVVILVMWGLLVAAYVQTLFLNGNMVAIMGQQTGYSELNPGNISNLLIWAVIVLAPICIWLTFKIKKKDFRFEKAFVLSLVVISGMQVAGLVGTAATTDLPEGFDENPVYFTLENSVNFSTENNVIVFILDTLDVRVIRAAFEYFPHLWEYLDGFTLYENHTAQHFGTVPTMVSLMTGLHQLPFQDGWPLIEKGWGRDRHLFVDTLRENGFSTNLYLDRNSTFNRYELIQDRTDNTMAVDAMGINRIPILSVNTRLSLGRLSPYLLKNTWLWPIATDFGRAFFYVEVENYDAVFVPIVGIHSDMKFHRFLMQAEASSDSEKNVFMLMHLNSAHANGYRDDPGSNGFRYIEETGDVMQGGTRTDIVRANFETLNLYFNMMKELGVYDNSTIIITGDHGLRETFPETVSLFIKPRDSRGPLTVDNAPELSIKYLPATILQAAGVPHGDYGISYFDIINGVAPAPPVRNLFVVGERTAEPATRIYGDYGIWDVVGDANLRENWTFNPVSPYDFFPLFRGVEYSEYHYLG